MKKSRIEKRQERNAQLPACKKNLEAIEQARKAQKDRQTEIEKRMRENIRIARITQRYSQQQLADRCGLTKQTISNIETGKHSPNYATIMAITNVLGIEAVWGIDV